MDTACSRPAYAKINLHLAVGLPYPDGYHPIQSLFALVGLSDTISLVWKKSRTFAVQVHGLEAVCSGSEDTLTKAARLWHEAGGYPLQLDIRCDKQIPVKAGLGGGSSDAAALLTLLQAIDPGRSVSEQLLKEVALQVGSDVPFFLSGSRAALVTGKGENVAPVESRSMPALLVMPTFFDISTSSAYRMLDEMRLNQENVYMPGIQELLQIYEKPSHKWRGLLYNDFQSCSS
ncbi:MAG: 4-(cytidine 5'-diphospho)-2-C-methyl-D-erythritol kinase, partial [Sphaerochaeta sp.]|nr:4-(cytidine 5'-diphospho)-2-C-methyl-D-erythritol kinase [Sphaerochaeta sp.]